MAENENAAAAGAAGGEGATTAAAGAAGDAPQGEAAAEAPQAEITYHAVEKDGQVTAIWEMQGRKHVRTIDPRSRQGKQILDLYTADHE